MTVVTLDGAGAGKANLSGVIVCHCNVVTSSDVVDAYEDGARTLSAVCRRTGAAQHCGACVFSVRQALCEHVERPVVIEEASLAAS